MKLMQEIDVDNVTITINGENKLAMVQPTNSGSTFDVASLPEKQWEAGSKIVALDPQGNTYIFPINGGIQVTTTTTNNVSSTNNVIHPRFTSTFEDTTQTIPTPSADGLKIGIICDEQGNRVGYTGVKLEGTIPENITEVVLTKADNTEVRFNYENSKDTYTYQVDTVNYETSGENLVKLTLVTAQGNVVEDLSNSKCSFLNFPS